MRAGMERGHAWTLARARLVRALIGEAGVADPLVLDAGCGTGAFAASLAEDGARVVAVDAHPPDTAPAGLQLARADVGALPFADATFDIVLLLDVLEHVADEGAVLRETARVLKPAGTLIVTVPALRRLWSARDERAGHVRRYERDELGSALSAAGFEVGRLGFWAATTLPLLTVSRAMSRREPGALAAEERPPAVVNAALAPLLRFDVSRALSRGWRSGSSLYATARLAG